MPRDIVGDGLEEPVATSASDTRRENGRQSILDLSLTELTGRLDRIGYPAYRGDQICEWVFRKGAQTFSDMTNLPQALREWLEGVFVLRAGRVVRRSSAPDGTIKMLLAWPDGATTESVMIPAPGDSKRRTVCLSSQVGCDVGCRFCASGLDGSSRNLSVGEIIEQAVVVSDLLRSTGQRLSHVVFMGMGEPLANYRATVEAVRRLNADWGLGIAQRRITVSTVGLPKQIEDLAEEGFQITLALSLHAAEASLRRSLIPWAERLQLPAVLAACETYFQKTGREVTLEYCLLEGVNDRPGDVERLARVSRRLRAHVNLLMYNPVESLPFRRPSRTSAIRFLHALRELGVNAHLRESRGLEADAACGQLRRRHDTAHGSSTSGAARRPGSSKP